MNVWQPDWASLNRIAAAFTAATPLAADIVSVTPPGAAVVVGLQLDLAAVLAANPAATQLIICADTLSVAAGETSIASPAVMLVVRSLQVAGGGNGVATLVLSGSDTVLQLATTEIFGSLGVKYAGTNTNIRWFTLSSTTQVSTVSADGPIVYARDQATIADVLHSPWAVLSLQVVSAMAGVIADIGGVAANDLATAMLNWVSSGAYALLQQKSTFANVDANDIASMLAAANAQLVATQAAVSGAIYVPVLSSELYQQQVGAILGLAQVYDQKITALQAGGDVASELGALAATLGTINSQAAAPLLLTLQNLANSAGLIQSQLVNAAVQLTQICGQLPALQTALQKAIQDEFQRELAKLAFDTLVTIATLYIGGAAAVVGDPELLTLNASKVLKFALDQTKAIIDAAKVPLGAVIAKGAGGAGDKPSTGTIGAAMAGGQVIGASMASFGQSAQVLWTLVANAIANAPKIDYSPAYLAALTTMPDLSGFSIGGLDPVAYWQAVVAQIKAVAEQHKELPQAGAYLEGVELASAYGSAVGDLQMKLLDLYTQGVTAYARLQTVYQAQAQWTALQAKLKTQADQTAAAIGLLQRGYLDVKRTLVGAVGNYRAAFAYQWLQQSNVHVDVTMDYLTLAAQAQQSINSLIQVLSGNGGGTVRPRQDFTDVHITVAPKFVDQGGGVFAAEWSLSPGDTALSSQLGGNTAIFLTEAKFTLVGGTQPAEVELVIANSGRYQNQLGANAFRFVSQAVEMSNFYRPGPPLTFVSSWSFADKNAYMAPTPYTTWRLRTVTGRPANQIAITLSGIYLQAP